MPVVLSGVGAMPGQYVFGDSSGAVVIPDRQIAEVLAEARELNQEDARYTDEIRGERLSGE